MTALNEFQEAISGAAERLGPSVVGLGRGWGLGSGVIVAKDRVLTNAHNLRRDEATVTFSDGTREPGQVMAVDSDLDLAVVNVKTNGRPPLEWAEQAEPGIGTALIALANPGGRGLRATLGFVSSGPRSFRGPRGRRIAGAIEHTAALPRGSSGGPLVDLDGRLVGPQLDPPRRQPDPGPAGGRAARARSRAWHAARRPPVRGSAWPWRRREWLGACAGRSGCRSATACSCARWRRAVPPSAPASSAVT